MPRITLHLNFWVDDPFSLTVQVDTLQVPWVARFLPTREVSLFFQPLNTSDQYATPFPLDMYRVVALCGSLGLPFIEMFGDQDNPEVVMQLNTRPIARAMQGIESTLREVERDMGWMSRSGHYDGRPGRFQGKRRK